MSSAATGGSFLPSSRVDVNVAGAEVAGHHFFSSPSPHCATPSPHCRRQGRLSSSSLRCSSPASTSATYSGFPPPTGKGKLLPLSRRCLRATPAMEWWFGSRRKKMAPICFFLLLQIAVVAVHSQSPSTQGFISIDCGSTANYTDTATGIPYVSDGIFTDTGINSQISSNYVSSSLDLQSLTLRSFPNSSRSCYVLTPVTQYNKYALRATFLYGNYDGENSAKQFDLYIDANFWITPKIADSEVTYQYEAVVVALADSIAVCLVNTGTGTPFISTLELRPLPNSKSDLSHNNLTGSIPDSLGTLSSLQDLCDGNPYLSTNGTSPAPDSKHKSSTAIIVALCVVGVLLILFVVLLIVWRVRRPGPAQSSYINASNQNDKRLPFENQQFTYKELHKITNGFMTNIGKGGFGSVFLGRLEDGSEIAAKMLSQSSSQGTKEFYAEVQNLTRIHHKKLVNLVGYCMEEDHLALVYEFMPKGTLQDHLTGKIGNGLSWGWRLQIAIEAAEGLDYLHVSCRPAVIHRDVKSANILLTENLEAKIADFGLSRACNYDNRGPISTTVVGTPGYLDPEYHNCLQLSDRSDVYSFGVVLLELITGRPPIVNVNQNRTNVTQWTRQKLSSGIIENVVDIKLRGEYDINSMWKTTDLALRCTESTGDERPSMTDVVVELKESLMLERASNRPRSY
ncbi:hypothetical protein ZIOFF_025262 [Zingiber officinale]|uniref:Protein kinase domain-containing protein n=1 Tax=Zingiber officinale TaxID=94328 RepID=A0A8J5GXJ9_ZINOF|nr:hypothetical protein ZIOFF_025262 [Zingiber officinale]